MAAYAHSKVFSSLKKLTETVSTNFTSLQYLQTLDYLLWKSLEPLAKECPALFCNFLAKVAARQLLKPGSKFTSGDKDLLAVHIFNMVAAKTDEERIESAKSLYINRGILFGLISFFLDNVKHYVEIHNKARLSASDVKTAYLIEQQVSAKPNGNLYNAIQEVIYWDSKARKWKECISEKYIRMAIMQAKSTYVDFGHNLRLDDVIQIYLMTLNKAIDRCDARQGVLTTYIQSWLKSARSEVAKASAESNAELSFESLIEDYGDSIQDLVGVTQHDTTEELTEHVAYIAYKVDRKGLVRTALGIPQYVSKKNIRKLQKLISK